MSRTVHPLSGFVLSFAIGAALGACRTSPDHPAVPAHPGILDTRTWDWQQPGTMKLDGEWAFYWNQLLSPDTAASFPAVSAWVRLPSVWNGTLVNGQLIPGTGCATYRLQVLISPTQELLALRTGNVSTALNLYINGQKIYQAGTVGCRRRIPNPSIQTTT